MLEQYTRDPIDPTSLMRDLLLRWPWETAWWHVVGWYSDVVLRCIVRVPIARPNLDRLLSDPRGHFDPCHLILGSDLLRLGMAETDSSTRINDGGNGSRRNRDLSRNDHLWMDDDRSQSRFYRTSVAKAMRVISNEETSLRGLVRSG